MATKVDVSPMEQATKPTMAQDPTETTPIVVATAPEPLSTPTDRTPIESAENALRDTEEATKAINLPSTWEGAVARIKWVMDTVSPAAEVRHGTLSLCLTELTFALSFTRTQRWHVACY